MIIEKKGKIPKSRKGSGEGSIVDHNIWFHDIEVFPNYSLFVFRNRDTRDLVIVQIHDKDNGDLGIFLSKKPALIGYNCLNYDGQVIEYVLRNPSCTVGQIKAFNDKVIEGRPVYKKDELSLNYLDVMEYNNYGLYGAKTTSLKHLAFFFRFKNVADSPVSFNDTVSESEKEKIIKYCIKDVDVTETIYTKTLSQVNLRLKLGAKEGLNLMNLSETNLAKAYFLNRMSLATGIDEKELKYKRTYRDKIEGKNLILPYIKFETEQFKDIKRFYENISLYPSVQSKVDPTKRIIPLKKSIEYKTTIAGTEYDYKAGGLHGCYKRGVYESNDKWIIRDIDYQSFYPKLAIVNKFSPQHVDTNLYVNLMDELFEERIKYDKKTHFALNYAFKIIINLSYGLSSSEYGPFYDVEYTLKTCVNGMLTISMLMEQFLIKIPDTVILQANTDGITIMYPREHDHLFSGILRENEKVTGLVLEDVEYKKMIIYNVNSYMSVDTKGEVKQKNVFETSESMEKNDWYHKDPSMNIRAIALNEYFLNGKSVEETINNWNNIFDFCFGVKGQKGFKWMQSSVLPSGVISSKIFTDRLVRYYVGGNSSISKMWLKDKSKEEASASSFTLLNASSPITMCQSIVNPVIKDEKKSINRYPNLNREYYIEDCKKIINEIETSTDEKFK